jgi:hypothetical protein
MDTKGFFSVLLQTGMAFKELLRKKLWDYTFIHGADGDSSSQQVVSNSGFFP